MCQAKVSLHFTSVLVWTLLASLTFGFCSIWSLHFVAMLACELDLQIGINVPLTLLSSILAVAFTFAALGSDLLWESYNRGSHRADKTPRKKQANKGRRIRPKVVTQNSDSRPLLNHAEEDGEYPSQLDCADSPLLDPLSGDQLELDESSGLEAGVQLEPTIPAHIALRRDSMLDVLAFPQTNASPNMVSHSISQQLQPRFSDSIGSVAGSESSGHSQSRQSCSLLDSNSTTSYGIGGLLNMAYRTTSPAKNAFVAAGEVLYAGFTFENITKGLCWSLAITSSE
jgi:Bacterial signalling protein N terminal repeat